MAHMHINVHEILYTKDLTRDEIIQGDYEWYQDPHGDSSRCGLIRNVPIDINDILPARITDIRFNQGASGQGGLGLTALYLDNGWKIVSTIYGSPSDLIEIITSTSQAEKIYLNSANIDNVIGQVLLEYIQDFTPDNQHNLFRLDGCILMDPIQDKWFVSDERACIWDL